MGPPSVAEPDSDSIFRLPMPSSHFPTGSERDLLLHAHTARPSRRKMQFISGEAFSLLEKHLQGPLWTRRTPPLQDVTCTERFQREAWV